MKYRAAGDTSSRGTEATIMMCQELPGVVSSLKCSTGPLANNTSYGLPLAGKDVN